jgi:hypothetical protein
MTAKLLRDDLIWCLRRLPRTVFEALKANEGKLFLAGGYIRSCIGREPVNDIDLLACNPELAKAVALAMVGNDEKRLHSTDNAYTLKGTRPTVQIIHRWTFATPLDAIASFDFTIASAAIWFADGGWRSVCDDRYYGDLAAKRLVYRCPMREEEAGGSMLRVLKFYQRGYRIPLDSLGAIVARLTGGVDWAQIHGTQVEREKQAAKVITGLFRDVDPNIDPTHEAHLPSSDDEEILA